MHDVVLMRRRRLGARAIELTLACAITAACQTSAFSPSLPLAPGADIHATFDPLRGIAVGPDSVLLVTELYGSVVELRGDTMAVRLTRVVGPKNPRSWVGHQVQFTRDSTMTLVKTNIDTPVGTVALVGAVTAFLAYMMGK